MESNRNTCSCSHGRPAARIVRGNDFTVEATVTLWGDEEQKYAPYSLDGAADLKMCLVGDYGRVGCVDVVADGSVVCGKVCGRALGRGVYGLEVTFGDEGGHGRIYEAAVLEIVESGEEATTVTTTEGEGVPFTVEVDMTVRTVRVGKVVMVDSYPDLTGKPSIGGVTLDGDLTLADIGAAAVSDLDKVATSGSYNDLSDLPSIPTKVGELENDKGYLTEHQDISGKVDKVEGKGLSTNDYTDEDKKKVAKALTEHQPLGEYAKATDVDAALAKKADQTSLDIEMAAREATDAKVADNASAIESLQQLADNYQMSLGYDEDTGDLYVEIGSMNTTFDHGDQDEETGDVYLYMKS